MAADWRGEGDASRKAALAKIALAALALAGMALTYYRLMFFYAAFALAWLVCWGLPTCRAIGRLWLGLLGRLALTALMGGLLFLPWWLRMQGSALAGLVESGVAQGTPLDWVRADYQAWAFFFNYVSRPLFALALIGLAWSLLRKDWGVAGIALWALGLASLKALALLRIPGVSQVQNFAVLISLYLPAALLEGYALGLAAEALERFHLRAGRAAALLLIVAAGAWFAGSARHGGPAHLCAGDPPGYARHGLDRRVRAAGSRLPGGGLQRAGLYRRRRGRRLVDPAAGGARRHRAAAVRADERDARQAGYSQRVVQLVKDFEVASLAEPRGLQALCEMGVTHITVAAAGLVGEGARQSVLAGRTAGASRADAAHRQDRVAGVCIGRAGLRRRALRGWWGCEQSTGS